MKLIRFGAPDHEKTGIILDDGHCTGASAFGADYDGRFLGDEGSWL